MTDDYTERGIRKTIISFDPFLKRKEIRTKTDAQVGREFGLATQTVKAMRLHQPVPFETIQILCHRLECQPGDIMDATTVYYIPAKNKGSDE